MNVSVKEARRRVALGALAAAMLAATLAFGESHPSCYEAYMMSGLVQHQMSFEEFSQLYRDDLCFSELEHQEMQAHGESEDIGRTHGE